MTAEERRTYRNKLRKAVENYRLRRREAVEEVARGGETAGVRLAPERLRWAAIEIAELVASRGRS